jgi:hypothetical protein
MGKKKKKKIKRLGRKKIVSLKIRTRVVYIDEAGYPFYKSRGRRVRLLSAPTRSAVYTDTPGVWS